jgi:hypothetical protein
MHVADRINPRLLVRMGERVARRVEWKKLVQNPPFSSAMQQNKQKDGRARTSGQLGDIPTSFIGWMPANGRMGAMDRNKKDTMDTKRLARRVHEVQSKRAKGSVRVGCCGFGRNGQLFRSRPALSAWSCCPRATAAGRGKNLRRTTTIDVEQAAKVERNAEC